MFDVSLLTQVVDSHSVEDTVWDVVVLWDEDAGKAVHWKKGFLSWHRARVTHAEVVGVIDDEVVQLVVVIIKLFVIEF